MHNATQTSIIHNGNADSIITNNTEEENTLLLIADIISNVIVKQITANETKGVNNTGSIQPVCKE